MEKAWFMTPMKYSPNWKGIMAPMEYTSMVYSPKAKAMVLWKIVFWSGNHHGKRWKKNNIKCQSKLILCIKWSG